MYAATDSDFQHHTADFSADSVHTSRASKASRETVSKGLGVIAQSEESTTPSVGHMNDEHSCSQQTQYCKTTLDEKQFRYQNTIVY